MINLFEYQNKATFPEEHFEHLEVFLDDIWNKREKSVYYNEEENREEVQRFLQFFHKTKELKSNKFVGVIHFNDQTINLLPKIFHSKNDVTEDDVKVINAHVLWWLSYCRKLKFPNYFYNDIFLKDELDKLRFIDNLLDIKDLRLDSKLEDCEL